MVQALMLLKALGDESRLRIIMALDAAGELCACQIVGLLGVAGPTASRHLAVLERAKLVKRRRDGRWNWFRLDAEPAFSDLLDWIRESVLGDTRIKADRKVLEKILAVDAAEFCRRQRRGVSCPGPRRKR